ncbi:hypothetical protein KC355_g29 [Hortaea werneckii]|nr:hypothetical protein KC355_g29 [Hortaea werneckii]
MAIIILSYAEYYGANHSGKTSLCVRSSTSCSPPRRRTRSSTRSLCAISSLRIVLVSARHDTRRLEHHLLQLQLHTYEYWYDHFRKRASTSLLNLVSVKGRTHPKRSANAKAWERYDFLARSLWSQWLVQQLAACGPFQHHLSEDRRSGCVRGSECGDRYQAERRVKKILDEVVREAARRIEYTFFPYTNRIETGPEGQKTEDFVTWRQCRYAEMGKNFTYLAVNESDLPWETEWNEPTALPEVDRSETSVEWLEAVGLVEDVRALGIFAPSNGGGTRVSRHSAPPTVFLCFQSSGRGVIAKIRFP